MQRATQKDEKTKKEEEVMPAAGDFPHSSAVKRWYVVVSLLKSSLLIHITIKFALLEFRLLIKSNFFLIVIIVCMIFFIFF